MKTLPLTILNHLRGTLALLILREKQKAPPTSLELYWLSSAIVALEKGYEADFPLDELLKQYDNNINNFPDTKNQQVLSE